MKKYTFFLDIDGTLLPSGKRSISENVLDALGKARRLGCKVFINTGRPYCDVDLGIFGDEYFDGICSGGSYAVYRGKPIYSHFMPKTDIRELLTELMSGKYSVDFNVGGLFHRYHIGFLRTLKLALRFRYRIQGRAASKVRYYRKPLPFIRYSKAA